MFSCVQTIASYLLSGGDTVKLCPQSKISIFWNVMVSWFRHGIYYGLCFQSVSHFSKFHYCSMVSYRVCKNLASSVQATCDCGNLLAMKAITKRFLVDFTKQQPAIHIPTSKQSRSAHFSLATVVARWHSTGLCDWGLRWRQAMDQATVKYCIQVLFPIQDSTSSLIYYYLTLHNYLFTVPWWRQLLCTAPLLIRLKRWLPVRKRQNVQGTRTETSDCLYHKFIFSFTVNTPLVAFLLFQWTAKQLA